jgi:dihydrofolate reductase
MGRRTHESLGRPLPGRTNIVLSRRPGFHAEGCLAAHSKEEALRLAEATGSPEAFIIGGEQVYREFLPICKTAHVTLVGGDFEGDVFFPAPLLGSSEWIVSRQEPWPADERNLHSATYLELKRV